jgi:hypothetical protein
VHGGGKTQQVTLLAVRLKIKAHVKRRFVIALKYEAEEVWCDHNNFR